MSLPERAGDGSARSASAFTTLIGFTILASTPLPTIGELGILTVTIVMTTTVAPALLSFMAPRT